MTPQEINRICTLYRKLYEEISNCPYIKKTQEMVDRLPKPLSIDKIASLFPDNEAIQEGWRILNEKAIKGDKEWIKNTKR